MKELNWTVLTIEDKTFFAQQKSQFHSLKVKCVSMHDNAPSHVYKLTRKFFEHKKFIAKKIMEQPPSSLDLNPIENLWSIVKIKLYEGVVDLWEAIKTSRSEIEIDEVKKN